MSERQGFIGAVRCLQSKPGQTSDTFEGVKSRYDDFVALHITQTDYVHWVVRVYFAPLPLCPLQLINNRMYHSINLSYKQGQLLP